MVTPNNGSFRLTKHDFKIQFQKDTEVRNCTEYDCDDNGFDFVSFSDILSGKIPANVAFGM